MRVFHLLQQAHAALFRASDHRLRRAEGITASQNAVLFALTQSDGMPISALAAELRMGKSSLTALVDRMVAQSLVRREKSSVDARVQHIFIAPAGRDMVARTVSFVRAINDALIAPFDPTERATIKRFLTHVAQNADRIIEAASRPDDADPSHIRQGETHASV